MQGLRVRRILPYCDLGVCITLSRKVFFFFFYKVSPRYLLFRWIQAAKFTSLPFARCILDLLGLYMCICYIQKYEFSKHVPEASVIGSVSLGSLMGTRENFWLSSILSTLTNLDTTIHSGLRSERAWPISLLCF